MRQRRGSFALSFVALCATACGTGPMVLRETSYYAVPRQDVDGTPNTNYYRLRVWVDTNLGETDFRAGWFPKEAVDALYGDVSADGGLHALDARRQIEKAVQDGVASTTTAWIKEASDPNADTKKLQGLMDARRRVLLAPRISEEFRRVFDADEIEFNPAQGVSVRHSDEKQVFVLASDPDQVLGKIRGFAEDQKTALAVQDLGDVLRSRARTEMAEQEARSAVHRDSDSTLAGEAATTADAAKSLDIAAEPAKAKSALLSDVQKLLSIVRSSGR